MKRTRDGQIIIGAIVLLVVLAILVPSIITYVQNEGRWTQKEERTTMAFQLAEAGVERGFQQVIQSTTVWASLQAGGTIANYNFDQKYSDLPGGTYEVRVLKGVGTQTVAITGVGRDNAQKELRAITAIYANSASNAAIYAEGGLTLTSNPSVEWGPVFSPASITSTQAHPRFYSSGSISLDSNGATPPNTDNIQWWSYYPNLPPAPQIDLQSYLSSATAQGHYYNTSQTFSLGDITGTYYIDGDLTMQPHNFLTGNLIVTGNFTLQGNAANGSYTATLPTNAWKEYGNDWASYRSTYDGSAPATFPGVNGTYSHGTLTCAIDKVVVHGFMYVGNSFSITGGGNCCVHGSMYVGDSSSLDGSHVKIYYDDTLTILTKNVSLARSSWQEITGCSWTGANPTCP